MTYNSTEDMTDHYSDNLRHMAEPATPSDREEAVSISLDDYKALWLASMLREWAGYHAEDENMANIARGYVEYINQQVRDNGQTTVTIYTHTKKAAKVVTDGFYEYHHSYRGTSAVHGDLFRDIEDEVIDLWGRQNAERVNRDAERKEYELPPERITVEAPEGDDAEVYQYEG